MLADYQGPLLRRPVKDSALAGSRFLRDDVVDGDLGWVLQMKGIQHRIADVQ
jgi:hypothetical protein